MVFPLQQYLFRFLYGTISIQIFYNSFVKNENFCFTNEVAFIEFYSLSLF